MSDPPSAEGQRAEASRFDDGLPPACPPADALDAEGTVFYAAFNPPRADDFRTAFDNGIGKNSDPCVRRSLSVHRERDRIEALTAMPRHHGKSVLKAVLEPAHGKMKQTFGPGHYSVWFYRVWLSKLHEVFRP